MGFFFIFLKEYVFTLTVKWVSSDMLPPGTVAYFALNLDLTHLSLTAHTLCIFSFPTVVLYACSIRIWGLSLPFGIVLSFCVNPLIPFPPHLLSLSDREIQIGYKEKLFTLRGVKQRDRLFRDCTVLEVFRAWPDKAIGNLVWFWCWPFFEQEVGLCDLQKSLLT